MTVKRRFILCGFCGFVDHLIADALVCLLIREHIACVSQWVVHFSPLLIHSVRNCLTHLCQWLLPGSVSLTLIGWLFASSLPSFCYLYYINIYAMIEVILLHRIV